MKQFAVLIAAAVLLHICNVADAALPSSFSAFQSLNREKIRHGDTRIKALPGFHGKFPSKHYGGYITGKFYYTFQSYGSTPFPQFTPLPPPSLPTTLFCLCQQTQIDSPHIDYPTANFTGLVSSLIHVTSLRP